MKPAIVYSTEELRELLLSHSPAVINILRPIPGPSQQPDGRAALVSELSDKENLEILRDRPTVTCVLPIRPATLKEDIKDRATTLNKVLVSPNSSVILASHDDKTATAHYSLLQSVERWQVINEFGEYAAGMGCFGDFKEICMTVASELLTNAFYNAPRDAAGNPRETDRRTPVTLEKPVEASFGQDEKYAWIKVRDPFGTFNRDPLLKSLYKSASVEELTVNMGAGGAGIGLYMVFRWAAQLMFIFNPGEETTVLIKLLKTRRYKIFESQRAILEIINVR
ncbi:MAG: hypothetical protein KF799_04445 [Bdellovibrionales bacterium]|nr:hypothetical protein [Bdellovibrionales bacterium]